MFVFCDLYLYNISVCFSVKQERVRNIKFVATFSTPDTETTCVIQIRSDGIITHFNLPTSSSTSSIHTSAISLGISQK